MSELIGAGGGAIIGVVLLLTVPCPPWLSGAMLGLASAGALLLPTVVGALIAIALEKSK